MYLYINTYGTYVHIKDEIFEFRVPSESGQYIKKHIAPQKITSIVLGKGAAISSDAIVLAVKHQIDIVIIDTMGQPLGRFWHSRIGSTTKIRKEQLAVTFSQKGTEYIKRWLSAKLKNQYDFLQRLKKHREASADFIGQQAGKIKDLRAKLQKVEPAVIDKVAGTFRGLEGTAGRIYFDTLSSLLAKQYRFNGRSMRPAKDQFNAFLNYSYGILYSRVEKALMIAGLDPYVGIMHRDDYNKKSMVFDFIEPYRPWCDEVVFKLFSAKKINNSHTDVITGGMVLNKPGKELLLAAFTDFIDEKKINYKGKRRTRNDILMLEAVAFAQELLGVGNNKLHDVDFSII